MPYFITDTQPDCSGWATVKEETDGSLTTIGCHESKQDAIDQMVAVSLAEDMEPGGERNLDGPAAIVVDIDDTLFRADGSAIENVVRFVDEYEGEVLIVTARRERRREETIAQLEAVDIDAEYLYMRDSAMPEVAYKSDIVKDLLDVWNIELAIENNADVRAEYARLGITTLEPGAVDPEELPEMVERSEERAVDLTLPEYIRDAAARGIEYYEAGLGGDGLVERTIREARLMADGQISEDKVVRVSAWAARHMIDLEADQNTDPELEEFPGAGAVAFYLWGIDPVHPEAAIAWFDAKAEEIRNEDLVRSRSVSVPSANLFRMENGVETRRVCVNDFELREAGDGAGMTFVGYGAVFNSDSQPLPFIERIQPGAFARSLRSRNEIKMFVNHDTTQVLASKRAGTLRLSEDSHGLRVEADLPDTTAGRDMAYLIKRGDVADMSFGFSVPSGGDSWSADGQTRELREVRLHEVSVVTGFPAYEATTASVRSLDTLAEATGIESDKLNAAIDALEKGETLSPDLAEVLDTAIGRLRSERDDVAASLALKQKQLDLLIARV